MMLLIIYMIKLETTNEEDAIPPFDDNSNK